MKRIFLTLTFIIYIFCASSQVKNEHILLSKAEIFANKPGRLIEKQYIEINNVEGIDVRTVKLHDLLSDSSMCAIRFELQSDNQMINAVRLGLVDYDEVDNLIRSIEYLKSNVFKIARESYTEISITTRAHFTIGCFFLPEKKLWSTYIQLDKLDSKSTINIEFDEFDYLLGVLKAAKAKCHE